MKSKMAGWWITEVGSSTPKKDGSLETGYLESKPFASWIKNFPFVLLQRIPSSIISFLSLVGTLQL